MKTTLQSALLLVGCLGLSQLAAQAQCPAGATTTLNFATRNPEDWDRTAAPNLANPIASNVEATPTDVTAGGFISGTSNPDSYLRIRNRGLLTDPRVLEYNTLEWFTDYTAAATTRSSSTTFAFSRPLSNYSIQLQDIDQAATFIDVVTLEGYDVQGNIVDLAAGNFNFDPALQTVSGNTVTGKSSIDGPAAGLVTVTFPVAITKLVLTYSNTSTATNPGQ